MSSPTKPEAIKNRKQELARLVRNLADEPIAPDDNRYFPFHEAKAKPRGDDLIAQLHDEIEVNADNPTCQLFSGFRGSGKSTELRRLEADLITSGHKVLFVEGARVINVHQPLEPADLLVSTAAGVALALDSMKLISPATQSILGRLAAFFTNTNVDLKQLSGGMSVEAGPAKIDIAKFALEIRTNPSFKGQVQDQLRAHLSALVQQFKAFMAQARTILVGASPSVCPVLIMDDLEKVRGTGPEQDVVQQGMAQIFLQFSNELRIPGWHVIWTAPPYLALLNGSMKGQYDGSFVLPMLRVWENDAERSPDRLGIGAIKTCLRKRGNVDSLVFKDELLDRLILASSGHLRDLMALVKDIARTVYGQEDPFAPLNEYQIDNVIADYKRIARMPIFADDKSWLRKIADSRDLELPSQDKLGRVSQLIDTAVIMTYRNGQVWYDVSSPGQSALK